MWWPLVVSCVIGFASVIIIIGCDRRSSCVNNHKSPIFDQVSGGKGAKPQNFLGAFGAEKMGCLAIQARNPRPLIIHGLPIMVLPIGQNPTHTHHLRRVETGPPTPTGASGVKAHIRSTRPKDESGSVHDREVHNPQVPVYKKIQGKSPTDLNFASWPILRVVWGSGMARACCIQVLERFRHFCVQQLK